MKNLTILILVCCVVFYGCDINKKPKKEDAFYTNNGGLLGKRRIPLIKPYELLKVAKDEWRMELLTTDLLSLSIHNVKGINVVKDKVLIFSEGGTEVKNKNYDRIWFIVDPVAKNELAFSEYDSFLKKLTQFDINGVAFEKPDSVYQEFYDSGKLSWKK